MKRNMRNLLVYRRELRVWTCVCCSWKCDRSHHGWTEIYQLSVYGVKSTVGYGVRSRSREQSMEGDGLKSCSGVN